MSGFYHTDGSKCAHPDNGLCRCPIPGNMLAPQQVGGDHYQTGDHEPFDVIDEWSTSWPHGATFYLANALKYIARLGRKSQDVETMRQDIDKAIHYLTEARKRWL